MSPYISLPLTFFERYPTPEAFEEDFVPWLETTYPDVCIGGGLLAGFESDIFDHFLATHFEGLQ